MLMYLLPFQYFMEITHALQLCKLRKRAHLYPPCEQPTHPDESSKQGQCVRLAPPAGCQFCSLQKPQLQQTSQCDFSRIYFILCKFFTDIYCDAVKLFYYTYQAKHLSGFSFLLLSFSSVISFLFLKLDYLLFYAFF